MAISNSINIHLVDYYDQKTQEKTWDLIKIIDHEFVPPLSSREGTTDMGLKSAINENELLQNYYQEILHQHIIVANINEEYAGFMTFKHNYSLEFINSYCPCNYITTLGVFPKFRKQGIASKMYEFILHKLPENFKSKYTVTRTWSSNYSHIHLLQKLNFDLVKILKDHRGISIDTVYYASSENKDN